MTYLKEIVSMVVQISAIIIAGLGLYTWKKQLKGTTKYQIAKDVLIKTFKIRDEFKRARNPFMWAAEMSNAKTKESESTEDLSFKARVKRLNILNDVKQELEISMIEADAVFGKDQISDIKGLIKKVYEINQAFNSIYESKQWKNLPEDEEKIIREDNKILQGTFSDKDNFGKEILKLVEKIENGFRKFLK